MKAVTTTTRKKHPPDMDYSSDYDEPKKKRVGNSILTVLKTLVTEYEITQPSNISIASITNKYQVQHRRVYDLFNLYSRLGIAKPIARGRFKWIGIQSVQEVLMQEYAEIEIASLTTNIQDIFMLTGSPTLGHIAVLFLNFFIFLGSPTLNLRQVATLFHHSLSDIKSLERRMYLMLSFLELAGIVKHSDRSSEYILTLSTTEIVENAFKEKEKAAMSMGPICLEAMLKFDANYQEKLYRKRYFEYQRLITQRIQSDPRIRGF